MKRWLIALATVIVAGVIGVGAAYADNTSYHGGYNANGAGGSTGRCASCHRTHTASGPNLIKAATAYGLCTSCHGTTNGLDVVDGVEWHTSSSTHAIDGPIQGGTKGGGFVNSFMNTTMLGSGNPTGLEPSTSAHKVLGMPSYTGDVVWGIGGLNTGAGTTLALECTTCHDPHGGSGGTTVTTDPTTGVVTITRTPTYRILRGDIVGKVTGAAVNPARLDGRWIVPEDTAATKDFLVETAGLAAPTTPAPANTDPLLNTYYGQDYSNTSMTALSSWCAACHTRIHTAGKSDPANSSSGDAIYNFRHVTTGTSVENNLGTTTLWPAGSPGCVTCHTSHGSSAAQTRGSLTIPKPGTAEGGGSYVDSSLLRADSAGVCELCHNK
jgi:predicted CXXCH cytochrome family protein